MIEFRNVSKVYARGREELGALNDLSLTIDRGQFIAVVGPGDEVLQRQSFVERLAFSRGETRAAGEAEPVRLSLPVGEERRASDYRIFVSFELTPEEVAVNRRRGPR